MDKERKKVNEETNEGVKHPRYRVRTFAPGTWQYIKSGKLN